MKLFRFITIISTLGALLTSCGNDGDMPEQEVMNSIEDSFETGEVTDPVKVNQFEIQRVVRSFLAENGKPMSRASLTSVTRIEGSDDNGLYVVNFLPDKGYVVLSPSKNCFPVLAYSEEGTFDVGKINGGLQVWKEQASAAMRYLNDNPSDTTAVKARKLWRRYEKTMAGTENLSRSLYPDPDHMDMPSAEEMKILTRLYADSVNYWATQPDTRVYSLQEFEVAHPYEAEEIDRWAKNNTYHEYQGAYKELTWVVERYRSISAGPGKLIMTNWRQWGGNRYGEEFAFNYYFPVLANGQKAYAGCWPIAAGQLMYYHKWPNSYNWNAMELDNSTSETARLLFDIANQSNPSYDAEGQTGINIEYLQNTLIRMGYSVKRRKFDTSTAMSNTSAGKPVMVNCELKKDGKTSRHAWILGGWQKRDYHTDIEIWTFPDYRYFGLMCCRTTENYQGAKNFYINWGWGIGDNGWYTDFSDICPAGYDSMEKKEMLYDITPNK